MWEENCNFEVKNSLSRLEAMLEDAVADEKPASQILKHSVQSFEMQEEEEEDEVEAEDELMSSQSLSLVSLLSPTLGRLVSPYSVLARRENLGTARLVRTPGSAKRKAERGTERDRSGKKAASKRLALSSSARPVRSDLDIKLDTLKVTVRHQVEEDVRFEKMLEAALQ